jgi:hypothetical protein
VLWNRRKLKRLAEPRAHHYVFGHVVIRQMCSADSVQFFALMASDEQRKFLAWMWQQAEAHSKEAPQNSSLDDVKVTTCRVKELPTVVITLPATAAMAEAHMVAAVLLDTPTASNPNPKIRYFTLEEGEASDGSPRTVFCEWTESAHANYGDGPNPNVAAFIQAIEQRLD